MFVLRKLWLDGWLSYDKVKFDLNSPGVTRIFGPIGAGKSSIFEAVFYLLYGKTIRRKDSINDFANKVIGKGYAIQLTFTLDEDKYKIREVRGRKDAGLYFFKNGKQIKSSDARNLRKKIEETIGIPATEFTAIAFRGQQQAQDLVQGTPEIRAQTITAIFGLQRYDEVVQRCAEDLRIAKETHKDLEKSLKEYSDDFRSLENNLLEEDDPTEIPSEEKVKKIEKRIVEVVGKLTSLNSKIGELKEQLAKHDALESQKKKIELVAAEIKSLEKKLKDYKKPGKTKKQIEKDIEELIRKRAKILEKIAHAQEEIENVEKFTNKCPVSELNCPVSVPIKLKKKTINKFTEVLNKAKLARDTVHMSLEKRQKLKERAAAYHTVQEKIWNKTELLDDLSATVKLKGNATSLRSQLAKKIETVQKFSGSLATLQEHRTKVKTALAVFLEREKIKEKVERALQEKEEIIKKLKAKVAEKHIETQYLSGALSIFKKVKLYKIDVVLEELNKNINDILSRISDGEYKAEFVSQRKSADKKKTLDKLSILVYDHQKEIPIELCSGGQGTEVGLAVLLSTWKTARAMSSKGVSSLWLDEVFGPLNEEEVDRVFDAVIGVAQELGTTSVYVISHRDLDPRLFDNIWSINRKNGITTVGFT